MSTDVPLKSGSGAADGGSAATNSAAFHNIRFNGQSEYGVFKLGDTIFGWKKKNSQAPPKTFNASALKEAQWYRSGRVTFQLKVVLKDGRVSHFDDFKEPDYGALQKWFKSKYETSIKEVTLSSKGWHWGTYETADTGLAVKSGDSYLFHIPSNQIAQVTAPTKNEVAIEVQHDSEKANTDDQLLEIRLSVAGDAAAAPPSSTKGGEKAKGGDEENNDANATGEEEEIISPAHQLRDLLVEKAGVSSKGQEAVASLGEVPFVVPRGRFSLDVFRQSMKLHGRSFDYAIRYKDISKLFLLPKPDQLHVLFVMALERPMRQGQTSYPFVVMQLEKEKMLKCQVNLSDEEMTAAQKKVPKLQSNMEGKMYDVLVSVLKCVTDRSVIIPPQDKFKSALGDSSAIRCSLKANEGFLYPLSKCFLFLTKPVVYVKYDQIMHVDFNKHTGPQTRYFEFRVITKDSQTYEFTAIERDEYQPLLDFLQNETTVRVKNAERKDKGRGRSKDDEDDDEGGGEGAEGRDEGEDEESEDEDYEVEDSDEEEEGSDDEDEDDDADEDDEGESEDDSKRKKKTRSPEKRKKDGDSSGNRKKIKQ